MPTTQLGIIVHQGTMDSGNIAHLIGYVCVTDYTAICHGCRFPGRGVTGFAVPAGS